MSGYGATPWYFRLRSRNGQAIPEILEDGVIRLQGEKEWMFEGSAEEVAAIAAAVPGAQRLTPLLVLVSFGNSVGYFDVPGMGRIETVSGKWDIRHFDQMLHELTRIAVNLPFSSGDGAALPYDRSVAVHEEVLYHAFVYLRHILIGPGGEDALLPALRIILRDPHRRFTSGEQSVPIGLAGRVSSRALVGVVGGHSELGRAVGQFAAAIPLARALRGNLPARIEETVVRTSFDTAENRFVKSFLALCSGTIAGMRRAIGEPRNAFHHRVVADCERMSAMLRPTLQSSIWSEVGPMVHFPAASTVLQRRRGYQILLAHWIRMRMATRIPLSPKQARDLLEVKDIAELYELWCFFTVVQAIERRLGRPERARSMVASDMQVSVPWDFEVRWADGVRAFYNPRFGRSSPGIRYSYSIPLRPDIGIEVPGGSNFQLHLLDAKFKLDNLSHVISTADEEGMGHEGEERRGIYKRGDIYKMHTYRDAIVNARSVWILYPGTEFSFHSALGGAQVKSAESLPAMVNGVGAIPLRPDEGRHKALDQVIATLLQQDASDVGR
jgi:uncharacterized protein